MGGCLKAMAVRVGCAVLFTAACVFVILFHTEIWDYYKAWRGNPAQLYTPPAVGGDARARSAFEQLGRRGGPAYEDLTAGDVAALVSRALEEAGGRRVLDSIKVALLQNEIRVQGVLDLSSVPRSTLGPLASVLGDKEPASIGGPLSADSSGGLVLTVTYLRLREFPFPRSTIPRILRAARVPGAFGARVPLPGTAAIGDVRVSPSGMRLYRRMPR
ncbi:MAG: hypothetical protein ACHQU1_06320 [Gemmatimonadales bacterium]